MALALAHGVRSIAFPAISTGIYGFPRERAAGIAVAETHRVVANAVPIDRVLFVCFDAGMLALYERALGAP